MKRGEVWTVAGGGDYIGEPRPCVILQDGRFDATASITICPVTSSDAEAPLFRLPVDPADDNGLTSTSRLMVDKISTVRKGRMGERIGRLGDADTAKLNRAVLEFLGLV